MHEKRVCFEKLLKRLSKILTDRIEEISAPCYSPYNHGNRAMFMYLMTLTCYKKKNQSVMLLKTTAYNGLDNESFCKLYKEYQQVLFKKLLLLLDAHEVVKDIVQEVFMKIWVRRKYFKADASLKTYMYRIGHNMIVDYYRSLGRKQRFAFISFSITHTDDDKIFLEDCLLKLEDVIDKLPPKRKQVFELCKFKQKSYEEAGEILNVSPSTISDHIVKANQFIRSELVKQVYSA